MKINYKGIRFVVVAKAYTENDGEYYVCFKIDADDERAYLIPTDSERVHLLKSGE